MRTVPLVIGLLAVSGCGTSSESDRRWLQLPADSAARSPKTEFETQTDTIAAQQQEEQAPRGTSPRPTGARYAVQIGSFRMQGNASRAVAQARQRFQQPVVNDYNSPRQRYQVRVGFFLTREDAEAFRTRIVNEYPREYGDAWVVRITSR
jgi:cell division septation protein DedD